MAIFSVYGFNLLIVTVNYVLAQWLLAWYDRKYQPEGVPHVEVRSTNRWLVGTAVALVAWIGLSLVMGYAGQVSLGQAAFFGLGAYVSAILTGKFGWSPWPALCVGMVLTGAVAFVVGVPSLKLKGHYLAMATLGFGVILFVVFNEEVSLTGGPSGFADIPGISVGPWKMNTPLKYY